MQKSEWASWAQAIGAIFALAVAIGLSMKNRIDARHEAKAAAMNYAIQLLVIAQDAVRACEKKDWQKFRSSRFALADTFSMAQAVPFALLKGEALAAYMSVRSNSVRLHALCEVHTEDGDWQEWKTQFLSFEGMAERMAERISKWK